MAFRVRSHIARVGRLVLLSAAAILALAPPLPSETVPGGFIEKADSKAVRPRWIPSQQSLPQRGRFTFPAPYNTVGIRLTNESDCKGAGTGNCINPVGYSYWRNINNHVGRDTMLIFLGLQGVGPTLFSYNKRTDEVRKLHSLFNSASAWAQHSGEGWYFSATQPTTLYVYNNGQELFRYDVLKKTFKTVFDVTSLFGEDRYIFQVNSSNDDLVHSFTVRETGTWKTLGCGVYHEDSKKFRFYRQLGDLDECHIDKSGRWLVMLEQVDGQYGADQRVIDLTGELPERIILDQHGAVGHADEGYGYTVGANNYNAEKLRNAITLYQYATNPIPQTTISYNTDWEVSYANHVSHTNAKPDLPPEKQYACGSNASDRNGPRGNEIVCFRLDSSGDVLVVADVMTDMKAPGGGDEYGKLPKGNLDVTGQYFIWTSNTGTGRLDAFLVKVPKDCLFRGSQRQGPCRDAEQEEATWRR